MFKVKDVYKKIAFLSILILITLNTYRIYQDKEGLFMDEVYSFVLANNDSFPIDEIREAQKSDKSRSCISSILCDYWLKEYTYDDFKNQCIISENNKSSVVTTYLNNSVCDEHPPLYYVVIHIICSVTHSSNLALTGYLINLLSMLITCWLVFKIVRMQRHESLLALISMAYFGFSFGLLCFVTYCRMYAMGAMFFTILVYYYIHIQKGSNIRKNTIKICIVELLLMLTFYFSLLFIVPIFLYETYSLRVQRDLQKQFIIFHIITCVLYLIIWPHIIPHFLYGINERYALDFEFIERLVYYSKCFVLSFLPNKILFIALSVFVIVHMIYSKVVNRCSSVKLGYLKSDFLPVMILPVLCYFLIVVVISPWAHHHYMYPIYPIGSIVFFIFLYDYSQLISNRIDVRLLLLSLFTVFVSVLFVPRLPIEYLYKASEQKVLLKYQNPAVILSKCNSLLPLQIMANYPHRTFQVVSDLDILKNILQSHNEFVLYISRSDEENLFEYISTDSLKITNHNVKDALFNVYTIEALDI